MNRLLEFAGRESAFYQEVTASKLLHVTATGSVFTCGSFATPVRSRRPTTPSMRVEYRRLGPRASSRSVSTKIAELDQPGTPREREKKAGEDSGFLWRLNAYWRYEQLGDGVLIECESVPRQPQRPLPARPLSTRSSIASRESH